MTTRTPKLNPAPCAPCHLSSLEPPVLSLDALILYTAIERSKSMAPCFCSEKARRSPSRADDICASNLPSSLKPRCGASDKGEACCLHVGWPLHFATLTVGWPSEVSRDKHIGEEGANMDATTFRRYDSHLVGGGNGMSGV